MQYALFHDRFLAQQRGKPGPPTPADSQMGIPSIHSVPLGEASVRRAAWHFPAALTGLVFALLLSCDVTAETPQAETPDLCVHAFYYPWYGNPETDGRYANWNHPVAVRSGPPRQFPGGEDIGANFFPELGCYSTNDPATVGRHMRQLVRSRVGVISVSWWGKGSFTDRALPFLFHQAEQHGIRICFHIEPRLGPGGRDATMVREAIVYLLDTYGESPALYRDAEHGNRPMFYIYDSYLTPADEWATILAPDGNISLRGTKYDSLVVGLWVKQHEERFFLDGHFDGFYTYFATDGFTYGSTQRHWKALAEWAGRHDKLFIPCVAPGYIDTRIRPWNRRNTRDRAGGAYYDRSFQAAIDAGAFRIGVTSFNEWHEGTQIEPAVPMKTKDFRYRDYSPREPTWYLDRTADWVEEFESALAGVQNRASRD
jgi:glycoprotein endo-alpha-1,2-mannosidase